MLQRLIEFVAANERCFERSLLCGHVTGSAWVVNRERTHALLVHHARLGRWLQPGGHCDGDPNVLGVALRETLEETGLTATPVSSSVFDVDAHQIPARKQEPAHIHYDVRFLLEADGRLAPVVSEESHDVRWVPLGEVGALNTDASVLRLVAKTQPAGAGGES
ncbi:MAG: NUDIX hydrolase [Acidobacteria bacterium]|nr:NUDIX hydrolase [Acidobacteriota bacterium]